MDEVVIGTDTTNLSLTKQEYNTWYYIVGFGLIFIAIIIIIVALFFIIHYDKQTKR